MTSQQDFLLSSDIVAVHLSLCSAEFHLLLDFFGSFPYYCVLKFCGTSRIPLLFSDSSHIQCIYIVFLLLLSLVLGSSVSISIILLSDVEVLLKVVLLSGIQVLLGSIQILLNVILLGGV